MASKRKFIKVKVPIIGEEVEVLGDNESLKGKTIKLDLTRKLKGKSMEVIFFIKELNGILYAFPKKISLIKQYAIKFIRKGTSYVEDSFKVKCKDVSCVVKPLLVTRKKVPRSLKQTLRKKTREFIIEELKNKDYLDFCEEVIHGEFQKKLYPVLKKIYPLTFCEIRILETKELNNANLKISEKKLEEQEEPLMNDLIEEES